MSDTLHASAFFFFLSSPSMPAPSNGKVADDERPAQFFRLTWLEQLTFPVLASWLVTVDWEVEPAAEIHCVKAACSRNVVLPWKWVGSGPAFASWVGYLSNWDVSTFCPAIVQRLRVSATAPTQWPNWFISQLRNPPKSALCTSCIIWFSSTGRTIRGQSKWNVATDWATWNDPENIRFHREFLSE